MSLGFHKLPQNVSSVRAGKYIEIKMGGGNQAKAEDQVTEMCSKILANLVIENFRFEPEPISPQSPL